MHALAPERGARCRGRFVPWLLALVLVAPVPVSADSAALVAAASSLRQVWPALIDAYPGETPRVSFGASGNLARQIQQGAPFELFLSADETMVERVIRAGKSQGEPHRYAQGQLQLIVRRSSFEESPDLASVAAALVDGRVHRLAIANPQAAPYGQAALQALEAAGLRAIVEPYLAMGESAGQAYQFVLSGAADAGIVPRSLVVSEPRASLWSIAIDSASHATLAQTLILTSQAGAAARDLADWLLAPEAQRVLQQAGFEPAEP